MDRCFLFSKLTAAKRIQIQSFRRHFLLERLLKPGASCARGPRRPTTRRPVVLVGGFQKLCCREVAKKTERLARLQV